MITRATLMLGVLAVTAPAADVTYVEQAFVVPGEFLGAQLVDVDGDGRTDLVIAQLERATRRRSLAIHAGTPDGLFSPEATTTIPILDDILAWGLAEVRADPGRELVFLTRAGAYAYSPAKRGYKGNIERLVEAELIYDVPDPQRLPAWRYVLPDRDGDRLLLPESGGFRIWGPPPSDARDATTSGSGLADASAPDAGATRAPDAARYVELGAWFADDAPGLRITGDDDRDEGRDALIDAALELTGNAFGLGDRLEIRSFLEDGVSTRAPALADVDGDGHLDMLLMRDDLRVYLGDARGIPAMPTRVETFPEFMSKDDKGRRDIDLADVDGDGDVDLVVHLQAERDEALGNRIHDVLVLRNDGKRLLPAVADDLRRVEAAWADVKVSDVDGDGRPDLVIEKAESPSQLELVRSTKPTVQRAFLMFKGGADGRFSRKAEIDFRVTIELADLSGSVSRSDIGWDCSGDGVHDRVDVDLEGRVSIRRLLREKGFFGGETWTLENSPWKEFPGVGSFKSLDVRDVNGDGLGDILTSRRDRVTVLLSRIAGARR